MFFCRLSGIQEYGFHSGLQSLMWASDHLNGALTHLDWPNLKSQLDGKALEWTDEIIRHATDSGVFFSPQPWGECEIETL